MTMHIASSVYATNSGLGEVKFRQLVKLFVMELDASHILRSNSKRSKCGWQGSGGCPPTPQEYTKTRIHAYLPQDRSRYGEVKGVVRIFSRREDLHFLFKSRKGKNYPLTTYAVTMMVQRWCDAINLSGNYGAHTLRKTWCYHQRKTFGVSWEILAKRLNHSTPSITRRYIGVQMEEVEGILLHTI